MTLQGTHGVEELIPTDDALDTHGWRPHATDRHHQSIIGECQRIDHSNALALLQKFASVELDGIGIAPTPGPKHIGPNLEPLPDHPVLRTIRCSLSLRLSRRLYAVSCKSPTAFTRRRNALLGR